MKRIGLTGGIGCGKSAAAAYFRDAGIPVIDADGVGHLLLDGDAETRAAVVAAFGDNVIGEDGAIARDRLAAHVFSDAAARAQLNAILHPAIINAVSRQCAALEEEGRHVVIIEAALLGEHGRREPWLTGLILVLASEETRINRLVQNRRFSREEAQRRIAAQTPPESKRPIADWIIQNDGDMQTLRQQVEKLVAELTTPEG